MLKKIIIGLLIIALIPIAIYFFFPSVLVDITMYAERSAAGLEVKSIQLDDHKVMYVEGGKGETLLFIHGYGQNKENWNRMAKYLTRDYHVVSLDLPGFGESSKIESMNYNITEQAKRLDAFCERVNLERFHIIGNSMGGSLAGCYALYAREKVLSLALFNTSGVPKAEKSELMKMLDEGGKNPFEIETRMDFDQFLKWVFVTVPPIPGPVKDYFIKQAKENREFLENIGEDLMDEKYAIDTSGLRKNKIKTLILWGDKDRLCHISGAYILHKEIPDSKLVILKDCGHAPMLERPEETAEHYVNFLIGKTNN
ncbi:MAG: alpha/beta hydrolase [Spirochaetota bacterium]|nr:alpha/beta hydrolase [Spirochaetota bacterium]